MKHNNSHNFHTLVITNKSHEGLNEGFERWEFECGQLNHDDII